MFSMYIVQNAQLWKSLTPKVTLLDVWEDEAVGAGAQSCLTL